MAPDDLDDLLLFQVEVLASGLAVRALTSGRRPAVTLVLLGKVDTFAERWVPVGAAAAAEVPAAASLPPMPTDTGERVDSSPPRSPSERAPAREQVGPNP